MSIPRHELVDIPTQYPFLTGDIFVGEGGAVRHIDGASMALTFADNTERTVTLERRADGRWWVPTGSEL